MWPAWCVAGRHRRLAAPAAGLVGGRAARARGKWESEGSGGGKLPLIVSPDRVKRAVVLEAVKAWPGQGGAYGKVGATANLDGPCARRRERRARRDEETGFEIEQRNR